MTKNQQDDWNPKDESVLQDQRRAYDEMRGRCPVAHSQLMGWSLFRHADIAAVLADPTAFSNVSRFLHIPNSMDPPEHGPYQKVIAGLLDDGQLARLEPRAREIAATLLGPMRDAAETDFIAAFATPFAMQTLCALLGWPDQQWEWLAAWVQGNQQAAFDEDPVAGKALAQDFSARVTANVVGRRVAPGDVGDVSDTTAALLRAEVDASPFSDAQIVAILRNWVAGHGTVAAALGILALYLAGHTDLQDRLRKDPSLIPAAIEEILRVDDPLVANRRTTTRALEIQGRTIAKGETLSLMWMAANRDPLAFDDPDVVKLERHTDAGMVWGQGIHLCLGARLARLEMRVALEELLTRTTRVELADTAPRRSVYPGNGLDVLMLHTG